VHRLGQLAGQAEDLRERAGSGRVLIDGGQRRRAPLRRHVSGHPIRRHVTGVHRLPAARVTGVARRPLGVRFGQRARHGGEHRAVQRGAHRG
jgi:hypothetical protein